MKKTILAILILAFCVSISGAGITDKLRAVIAAKNAGAPAGGGWALGTNAAAWENCEDASLESGFTETDADGNGTFGDADANAGMTGSSGGWEVSLNSVSNIAKLAYATADASISVGFWFKTKITQPNDSYDDLIFETDDGGGDYVVYVSTYCDFCSAAPALQIRGNGSVTTHTTLAQNTWYFISLKITRNGTSAIRAYDSSGDALEVADTTITGGDFAISSIYIGNLDSNEDTNDFYRFDDFLIYTDQTWPLDPL